LDPTLLLIITLVIVFLAALMRSTIGFGDALLAMPMLALFMDIRIATPVVGFMGVVLGASMLSHTWRDVDFKATWRLTLFSFLGIPIGIYLLKAAPDVFVKVILALVLIVFGAYNLIKPTLPRLKNDNFSYLAGFISGILGGAYNTNGPPVIIYGMLARWSPERFRATLQGCFLPTALMIMVSQAASGLWTANVLRLFAYSLPFILLAVFLGNRLSRRIPRGAFDRVVYGILIVMGVLLVI
jgi:uncharacterized protein